jgi:hypothetical protein
MDENMTLDQIKDKMNKMEREMRTLEWDDMRQQINPAKKAQLIEMRKEYSELKNQMSQLNVVETAQ